MGPLASSFSGKVSVSELARATDISVLLAPGLNSTYPAGEATNLGEYHAHKPTRHNSCISGAWPALPFTCMRVAQAVPQRVAEHASFCLSCTPLVFSRSGIGLSH